MNDGVREIHGVSSGGHYARVSESRDGYVHVASSSSADTILTVAEARYLGLKLLRLARRIEKRNEA